ncbi:hypothetical protein J421_1892 [Gemmatirosa kalamazoonensis]|uniref:Lipoprotein n=1 Tax=Gemmatirosa kalamazoonensis TaxID=861299 RepID=W0RE98_9BACT|nr:hypothetical protein [Gemmatirosa kalamazoonensis]AHG89429.1 hypothetical protein J421_1892 [Gemmatirosa kalamazoonensis]
MKLASRVSFVLALLGACRGAERPSAADSAYAPSVMIARFRQQVPERPTRLGDGAAEGADTLLARWARGVAARDTAALRPLALTVSEFAWLYYADSPMAQPPYELDPDVMWTQISSQSARGLTRALQRFGGRSLGAVRSACTAPRVSRALRLYDCTVAVPAAGGATLRLSVVERDGRFKLVGFGTNL